MVLQSEKAFTHTVQIIREEKQVSLSFPAKISSSESAIPLIQQVITLVAAIWVKEPSQAIVGVFTNNSSIVSEIITLFAICS